MKRLDCEMKTFILIFISQLFYFKDISTFTFPFCRIKQNYVERLQGVHQPPKRA